MQFDSRDEGWKPAHDPELRLRNPWALAIALGLLALGAVMLMAVPTQREPKPRPTVAGVMP